MSQKEKRRAASDEPRAETAGTATATATTVAPPINAPPETQAEAQAAAPAVPYDRYKIVPWADTAGRQFSQLCSRDGKADKFMSAVNVEHKFNDGYVMQAKVNYEIPATSVDEAFEKFDAAKAAIVAEAVAEMEHQHLHAQLLGQLPPRPTGAVPMPIPGGRGKKRLVH
jgi:hypothetical protein